MDLHAQLPRFKSPNRSEPHEGLPEQILIDGAFPTRTKTPRGSSPCALWSALIGASERERQRESERGSAGLREVCFRLFEQRCFSQMMDVSFVYKP